MSTRKAFILLWVILSACTILPFQQRPEPHATFMPTPTPAPPTASVEQRVIEISLAGPLAGRQAEISGMTWYHDTLILLPQYPSRFRQGEREATIFTLSKTEILASLEDTTKGPLSPQRLTFFDHDIPNEVAGFEGYEAIIAHDGQVFLTIEANAGDTMMGYLIAGYLSPDFSEIHLNPATLTEIPPQAALDNMTDETLLLVEDVLVTLYEANGVNVNPQPVAHRFDLQLNPVPPASFPNIEYRITDATAVDDNGRFWAINYFYPGDKAKLDPAPDPLIQRFEKGATYATSEIVERLLAFQYRDSGISLLDIPPIQLQLLDDTARNWEGLVHLDDRGFILVTDEHPRTILAFVPMP
jgi:hypothetical protein